MREDSNARPPAACRSASRRRPTMTVRAAHPPLLLALVATLAFALAAQACLLLAWWRQTPAPDGDTRLTPAMTTASGRMIVAGRQAVGRSGSDKD